MRIATGEYINIYADPVYEKSYGSLPALDIFILFAECAETNPDDIDIADAAVKNLLEEIAKTKKDLNEDDLFDFSFDLRRKLEHDGMEISFVHARRLYR